MTTMAACPDVIENQLFASFCSVFKMGNAKPHSQKPDTTTFEQNLHHNVAALNKPASQKTAFGGGVVRFGGASCKFFRDTSSSQQNPTNLSCCVI
eukprot:6380565-Amphidinium_carterae.1